MDPILVGLICLVLGFAAGFLVGGHNPKQAGVASAELLASEGRIVAAVNGAKDTLAAHNAKQAAATQTAIAAVHKDVAEVKGALTAFAAPADPPKS